MILDYPDTTSILAGSVEDSAIVIPQRNQLPYLRQNQHLNPCDRCFDFVEGDVQIHLPQHISSSNLLLHSGRQKQQRTKQQRLESTSAVNCSQFPHNFQTTADAADEFKASSSRSSSVENLLLMENDSGDFDMDVMDGIMDIIPGTMDDDGDDLARMAGNRAVPKPKLGHHHHRSFSTSLSAHHSQKHAHHHRARHSHHRHPLYAVSATAMRGGETEASATATMPIDIRPRQDGSNSRIAKDHHSVSAKRGEGANFFSREAASTLYCTAPTTTNAFGWINQCADASEEENVQVKTYTDETAPKAPRIIQPNILRRQSTPMDPTPSAPPTQSTTLSAAHSEDPQPSSYATLITKNVAPHQDFAINDAPNILSLQRLQLQQYQQPQYIYHYQHQRQQQQQQQYELQYRQQLLLQYHRQQRQQQLQLSHQLQQQQQLESDKENNQKFFAKKRLNKDNIERRPMMVYDDECVDDDMSVISCDDENNSLNGDLDYKTMDARAAYFGAQTSVTQPSVAENLKFWTNDDAASGFPAPPSRFFSVGDIIGYSKVVRAERYEALGALNAAIGRFSDEWPEIRRGWENNLRISSAAGEGIIPASDMAATSANLNMARAD